MHSHHDHDHHEHDHHDHSPRHAHTHHDDRPLENITHVHGGAPLLDIGDGIGALVVITDLSRVGGELFAHCPSDGKQIHTGIWRRRLGDQQLAAAVFCELAEGTYHINGIEPAEVVVRGGELTEVDIRTAVTIP